MSTLRHGRCGAPDGPLGTELTSVFVLRASTVGVQRTPLASMVSVDGAGSSAMGGEAEVPHLQLPEISWLPVWRVYTLFFVSSVDHKRVWKPTQRSHHTN